MAARGPRSTIGALAAILPALDAVAILDGPSNGAEAARWASRTFAGQVERTRQHLEPITDRTVLAASFGREASHLRPAAESTTATRGPIRVAYAIRWIELTAQLRLPDWPDWTESCTPAR